MTGDECIDDRQFLRGGEARRNPTHGAPRALESLAGRLRAPVRQVETGGPPKSIEVLPERRAVDEEARTLPSLDGLPIVQQSQNGRSVSQLVLPGAYRRGEEEERGSDEVISGLEEIRPDLEAVRARTDEEARRVRAVRQEHQGRREGPCVPPHDPPPHVSRARRVEVRRVAAELDPLPLAADLAQAPQEILASGEGVVGARRCSGSGGGAASRSRPADCPP
jgi:hypothetical protein